jgi:hypothetical protein
MNLTLGGNRWLALSPIDLRLPVIFKPRLVST